MSGGIIGLAIAATLSGVALQRDYPGASFILPDGSVVMSPILPPPHLRGPSSMVVYFVEDPNIPCGAAPGSGIRGCTFESGNIVLPNPCDPKYEHEVFAIIACHEKGHSLGWNHDKEDSDVSR